MKKQTLTLVLIGVILFVAGSAIAFASVKGASKHASNGDTGPTTMSAVVAKSNIPSGTSGQSMISNNLVAIELIPTKSFKPTDLTSVAGLNNEVLTQSVTKGQAISVTQLSASASTISIPTGMDAVTVTMSGSNALAGYLQPGTHVDVYANITKVSQGSVDSGLPVPCTELAMTNIQVLDVQSTSPSFTGHKSPTGRAIPSSETVLLAVTGQQARTIQFLEQNESLSVVQPQQGATPPPLMQCIGTDQTTGAP